MKYAYNPPRRLRKPFNQLDQQILASNSLSKRVQYVYKKLATHVYLYVYLPNTIVIPFQLTTNFEQGDENKISPECVSRAKRPIFTSAIHTSLL